MQLCPAGGKMPLATPFTLGVSSGASFGVVAALWFGVGSALAMPAVGVAGAVLVESAARISAMGHG